MDHAFYSCAGTYIGLLRTPLVVRGPPPSSLPSLPSRFRKNNATATSEHNSNTPTTMPTTMSVVLLVVFVVLVVVVLAALYYKNDRECVSNG